MRIFTRISLIFIFFAYMPFQVIAKDYDFKKAADEILSIDAKPGYHVETTRLLVIHPLIKDRETILIHYSKLTWENNQCTKTVLNFEKVKGVKPKGNTGVGQSFNYQYIPEELKNFCKSAKISAWEKKSGMKLDKKEYNGYSFYAQLSGEKRISLLYLSDSGEIEAVAFGFPESGISHANEMTDKGTIWYFKKINGKIALVKIIELTAEKKKGIPIIKKVTKEFNRFK